MHVCSNNLRLMLGFSKESILQNSSLKRSTDIFFVRSRMFLFAIAEKVSSSILNPNCPANLIARTGLKPSSLNLSIGEPTVLIIPSSISFCPLNGSMILPVESSAAMAFIVKSLRVRSSSIVSA